MDTVTEILYLSAVNNSVLCDVIKLNSDGLLINTNTFPLNTE